MDRDAIQRESQVDALGTLIRAGDIDVIIGTQMLFPRGRLPLAGFVGILNADTGLHLPDFRSTEHTYHALQDAVALCRPGNEGKVIIQTILPNHHAITAVVGRNPALFLRPELEFGGHSTILPFPPYSAHHLREGGGSRKGGSGEMGIGALSRNSRYFDRKRQ